MADMQRRLSNLKPQWLRYSNIAGRHTHTPVGHPADATGIRFLCPQCGDHMVVCWTEAVPPQVQPAGRWRFSGEHYTTLTLTGAPIARSDVCTAKFSIVNGDIRPEQV